VAVEGLSRAEIDAGAKKFEASTLASIWGN
jgi:hypothetical protein